MSEQSSSALRQALLHRLEDLSRAGVQQLPRPPKIVANTPQPTEGIARAVTPTVPPQPVPQPSVTGCASVTNNVTSTATSDVTIATARAKKEDRMSDTPILSRKQRENQLYVLSQEVSKCLRCEELSSQRTQTVFGVGNPEARLCFLGEGPGADEDAQGEPFVGRAGQLLNKIIAACTLRREDVYILNVVKCRPPNNRNPQPDEVKNCRPFFERQLEIIRPEFICCLGSVAASALLESTDTIGRLRGRFHTWRFARVVATYHPAYLLRNPPAKAEVWKDMQFLMKEMGIEIPIT